MPRRFEINGITLDRKAQEVLVYLYWNNSSYKSRSDIQQDLDLTYAITRRVTDDLLDAELVNRDSETLYGSAKDRYQYKINSQGIRIVEGNDLAKPEHQQVRGEIADLKTQNAYLLNSVQELETELNEWKTYVKQHNRAVEERIRELERENEDEYDPAVRADSE